ncbi:hypothetical protein P175DRAFT_0535115 [Aspergillus ochraceoroseus IBT 24754]|uniref:Uncharacterized protein n=1 Tax=Aspergillus ochraceoroseus IBT 24754 TaxID=1392256 RepID=A0A2T5LPJ4_9EURO|nr:uncharacterized protein P175DRAFT_0535115 [Aspergillus ochraceoroseus IBT 24754]PTU18204.1 hypothetical protein P175DRAFT_0535115 [Aspergillus ochraceoroseus IBT 24754]
MRRCRFLDQHPCHPPSRSQGPASIRRKNELDRQLQTNFDVQNDKRLGFFTAGGVAEFLRRNNTEYGVQIAQGRKPNLWGRFFALRKQPPPDALKDSCPGRVVEHIDVESMQGACCLGSISKVADNSVILYWLEAKIPLLRLHEGNGLRLRSDA